MKKTKDRLFPDSTSRHEERLHLSRGKPVRHLAALLTACLALAASSLGHAQYGRQYQFLVFDPIPIEIVESAADSPDSASPGSPIVRELASLPAGESMSLSRWLGNNTNVQLNESVALNSNITDYELAIRKLETDEGPFSAALPQQLMALGTAHQANGDFELALQYFEQASHITRINYGLFSNEQVPVVERIIESHMLQGDLLAADQQHNYLLFLQQKNLGSDSADLLPALNRYGEWNMFAFTSGSLTGNTFAPRSITMDEANFKIERLLNAQHIYWSIVEIIRKNFGQSDPRLLDAEMRLVLTNYLYATSFASRADAFSLNEINTNSPLAGSQLQTSSINNMGYRHGKDALERRLRYLESSSEASPAELAEAALDLADWMLLFNRQRMQALEMYGEIHEAYKGLLAPQDLERLFNPGYPVLLPAYIHASYSRATLGIPPEQALDYDGHLDVEYRVNRFGRVTQLEILGKSEAVPDLIEDRLVRNIRNSQFRPRFQAGLPLQDDRVQARYYFAY